MSKNIQVRVEDDLKQKSDELFAALGTSTNEAIKMFLMKSIRVGGIPFDISLETSRFAPETELAFTEIDNIKAGLIQTKSYSNVDELFHDLEI